MASAVIIIAVLMAFLFLKAIRSKAFDQILYRSEYKESKRIVSPIAFETCASVTDIMEELTTHVTVSEEYSFFKSAIQEISRGVDHITYGYGEGKGLQAVVTLTDLGGKTKGIFQILKWVEYDGRIINPDAMRKLRRQIKEAFKAADALVIISEGIENQG